MTGMYTEQVAFFFLAGSGYFKLMDLIRRDLFACSLGENNNGVAIFELYDK